MKVSRSLILALAIPASLAAQGGPPANPITAAFRGRITTLERNLAQAFDSIPERLFSYKPTPAQLTIGYIAQHLASDNYLFCNAFGDKKATVDAEETSTADSVKARWPREKLVTRLKASFAFCQEALAQLDDAKLAETVSLTLGGNTRQTTRAAMVLGHALDIADHYSQLANYMRLNGILPPTALPRPGRSGGASRDEPPT
ncbi:MAG: DinB family protein [Gemmatimonadaceae bacterium]|nr:DinB family protein [Gemmatimonadaceae bacterium]